MSITRQGLSRVTPLLLILLVAAVGALRAGTATNFLSASTETGGWLGVSVQELSEGIREATGLDTDGGVLVNEVFEGSPAEESGVRAGDVIVALDGAEVEGLREFVRRVREGQPGDEVELTLVREGRERTVTAELTERAEEENRIPRYSGEGAARSFESHGQRGTAFCKPGLSGSQIGVRVQDLNPQLAEAFGLQEGEGALVIEADEDGPAFAAGIRGGDVILRVDGEPLADTGDLRSLIREKDAGTEIEVTVMRNRKEKTFRVAVEEGPLSSIRERIELRGGDFADGLEELQDALGELDLEKLGSLEGLEGLKDLRIEIGSGVEEQLADLRAQLEDLRAEMQKIQKRRR